MDKPKAQFFRKQIPALFEELLNYELNVNYLFYKQKKWKGNIQWLKLIASECGTSLSRDNRLYQIKAQA